MEPPGSTSEDLVGSATSVQAIIDALARRGCSDLTASIDPAACSQFPLAGGGFCDVFRGALYEGTRVAIKCLRVYDGSEAEGDSEKRKVLKRAARELYHWSRLQHRNVLPLLGLAIFRGHISMISEWMGNGNLMAYLRLNPDADRNRLCMDVCEGLCYIHTNGMVHGDLKAANVMVTLEGTALIADFGNAQLKDLTLNFTTSARAGLSVRWAAPELLLNDGAPQLSKEADVYAYGMIMLEVITGKVPFEGTSDQRVLGLVAYERKVPPRPDVDMHDSLWNTMNLCWSQEASERPKITSIKRRLRDLFAVPTLPKLSQPPRPLSQEGREGAKHTQPPPSTLIVGSATEAPSYRHIQGSGSDESFGIALANQPVGRTDLPETLIKCTEAIENRGLNSVGIYATGGTIHREAALRRQLDWNLYGLDLNSSEWAADINSVASVLVDWFRELPEPLMTWDLYDSFIEAAQIKDKRSRVIRLREHVNELPDINYSVLKYLMKHLYRVSEREDVNQMSRSKLASVFGPVILRSSDRVVRPAVEGRVMSWECTAVKAILDQHADIFIGRPRSSYGRPRRCYAFDDSETMFGQRLAQPGPRSMRILKGTDKFFDAGF